MRAHVQLLEFLMKMWEPDEQFFKVGFHDLALEIEYIYFLTDLSRRGARVYLSGFRGRGEKNERYISQHCIVCTRKSNENIPIKNVGDISLIIFLFTISRVTGSATPHLDTNAKMKYAVDCMEPTIFN